MAAGKYYDWTRGRALDPRTDGCAYQEWAGALGASPFAVHPEGFLVFLPPGELGGCDEYDRRDPYGAGEGLEAGFHQRRIQCTLELVEAALGPAKDDARILDLGCGQGHITWRVRERFPRSEVSGLDCSISAIRYAAGTYPGIDFIVAEARNPPYSGEYFDVVVCNNLLEHIPDPVFLLERIRKVLKVGGHLVISTPSRYRVLNLMRVIRGKPVTFMSESHVTEYSVGQVVEQLRFKRFEVLKTYSKPVATGAQTVKGFLVYRLIIPFLRCFLRIVGSHHSLESTVFFLARKCP